jgi:aminoglycoside 3-N-acetyltransferase
MAETLTRRYLEHTLQAELGLSSEVDVLAHVDLPSLGDVEGGAETVVDALLASARTLVMPAFTYQTQIIPQIGPPDNAIVYGSGDAINAKAEIFRPDLPVHPDCGSVAEALRQREETLRSTHPILSFIAQGSHAREVLASQTRHNPLGPIGWLEAHDGVVLLLGVDQRRNFALHLAEQRAGRKTFTRWALTIDDIEELEHIPGCTEGFNEVWYDLLAVSTVSRVGLARAEVMPIEAMLEVAESHLEIEPNLMLCDKPSCLSCRAREV